MKLPYKLLLFFISAFCLFSLTTSPTKAVTWTRVNDDGFGDTTGMDDFFDMTVYHNCLYAGIEAASNTEGARVHRTCDGTNWTQVMDDGFGDPPENDHVDAFAEFGDYLYVSTAVSNATHDGFKLWRSKNGNYGTWEEVVSDGLGNSKNENLKSMVVFHGQLCGGTWNNTEATAVWCSLDGVNWTKKSDDGFGNANNTITWFLEEYNGYLYASTQNTVDGGQIWRTNDLENWSQVGSSGFGYGSTENLLRGLRVFKGALYTTAKNGSSAETEIKRSTNGTSFTTVATFSDTTDDGPAGSPQGMIVYNDMLHIATNNPTNGFSVYRSSNGTDWEQIASNGIDDSSQRYGILKGFEGYLYLGTRNGSTGQKVWRTYYFDASDVPPYSGSPIPPVCAGSSPPFAPDLFQVQTSSDSATMYFTPVNNNAVHYEILFGEVENPDALYGATYNFGESSGAIPFAIDHLKPSTNYFFKVMAANVCGPGPWSNTLNGRTTANLNTTRRFHAH